MPLGSFTCLCLRRSPMTGALTATHIHSTGIGGLQLLELRGAQAPEGDWFDQATQRLLGSAETMPWGEEITMEITRDSPEGYSGRLNFANANRPMELLSSPTAVQRQKPSLSRISARHLLREDRVLMALTNFHHQLGGMDLDREKVFYLERTERNLYVVRYEGIYQTVSNIVWLARRNANRPMHRAIDWFHGTSGLVMHLLGRMDRGNRMTLSIRRSAAGVFTWNMNISNPDNNNTAGQHGPAAPPTLATNALAEILPPLAEMPIPAPLAELPR